MNKLLLKVVLAGSLAAGSIGIGAGAASAATTQTGCVEWNSTQGCVVKQYCSVDTTDRTWSCLYYDTRTNTLTGETGAY